MSQQHRENQNETHKKYARPRVTNMHAMINERMERALAPLFFLTP